MKTTLIALTGLLSAAQAPAPTPAAYFSEAALMAALTESAKTAPAMHTAPIKLADHYRVNVVRRTSAQGAITYLEGRFDLPK